MLRYLLRRLALIPLVLVAVHFLGFAYGLWGLWWQSKQDPFFAITADRPPVWGPYVEYIRPWLAGDVPPMPGRGSEDLVEALVRTGRASLGLLAIAFGVSLAVGIVLGLLSVRTQPAGVAGWLIPVSAVSLSMPSFYIGAVLVTASIFYLFRAGPGAKLPFPLRGFGWDIHLVLPVIVLAVRPAMQIAQVTATVLADELHRQYVVAGRSFGHTWRRIRWRTALSNVLAPVVLTVSSGFRLLVVELILVEWLFGWPGWGSLLARSLVRPALATMGRLAPPPPEFLDPGVLGGVLVCFAALFLLGDLLASLLVRAIDPRLRAPEGEA